MPYTLYPLFIDYLSLLLVFDQLLLGLLCAHNPTVLEGTFLGTLLLEQDLVLGFAVFACLSSTYSLLGFGKPLVGCYIV